MDKDSKYYSMDLFKDEKWYKVMDKEYLHLEEADGFDIDIMCTDTEGNIVPQKLCYKNGNEYVLKDRYR